jgi:neurofibromin 1
VTLSRETLVYVSRSCLSNVVESLLLLLEELVGQNRDVDTHPTHVLHSEFYIIHLLADCLSTHWSHINTVDGSLQTKDADPESDTPHSRSELESKRENGRDAKHASQDIQNSRTILPQPMEDGLVGRILDLIKLFLMPLPEQYVLPASKILDDGIPHAQDFSKNCATSATGTGPEVEGMDGLKLLNERSKDIEFHTRAIMEFLSAANWSFIFEHLKTSLRLLQISYPIQSSGVQSNPIPEDDQNSLATLRILAFLWVDAKKLSLVLSELCSSFFHLRKAFQNTLGIALPILISRWLEQNPKEFIQMHITHTRIDASADRLFEITNTMIENGRWRAVLYPFQMSLLFLIPDVFEVATSMPSGGRYLEHGAMPKAGSGVVKKVAFLEGLRKAVRNRNPAAAYCLVSLLRVSRHFDLERSDAALLSYALDVQDEVREAIFRRYGPGIEATTLDEDLMTAAFVSLAHLNFETCNESIVPLCLTPSAPDNFKLAFVSACCHFAKQPDSAYYQPLYTKISGLIRTHLKVFYLFGSLG